MKVRQAGCTSFVIVQVFAMDHRSITIYAGNLARIFIIKETLIVLVDRGGRRYFCLGMRLEAGRMHFIVTWDTSPLLSLSVGN
jgi:hypothetical protein